MTRALFLMAPLLATMAAAAPLAAARKADLPSAVCPEPVKAQLFITPMGELFRPRDDDDQPVKRWFDQTDRDHDGRLTIGEMMLDADRWFALLDKDGDGELLPNEVRAYEDDAAEIRLYQARREPPPAMDGKPTPEERRPKPKKPPKLKAGESGYDGAMGAGRYGFLNIPNPIAAADADINRAVDLKEFRAAAAARFRDLDPSQEKALTLAGLGKTPAQVAANAACLERIKAGKEKRR